MHTKTKHITDGTTIAGSFTDSWELPSLSRWDRVVVAVMGSGVTLDTTMDAVSGWTRVDVVTGHGGIVMKAASGSQ